MKVAKVDFTSQGRSEAWTQLNEALSAAEIDEVIIVHDEPINLSESSFMVSDHQTGKPHLTRLRRVES